MEKAAQNRRLAFELRVQRWTYRMIADKLGVSTTAVHGYIHDVLGELKRETVADAEDCRQLELESLDEQERELIEVQREIKPLALMRVDVFDVDKEGQAVPADKVSIALSAVEKLTKIAQRRVSIGERRANLLGLDAPKKMDVRDVIGLDEAEQRFAEAMK